MPPLTRASEVDAVLIGQSAPIVRLVRFATFNRLFVKTNRAKIGPIQVGELANFPITELWNAACSSQARRNHKALSDRQVLCFKSITSIACLPLSARPLGRRQRREDNEHLIYWA